MKDKKTCDIPSELLDIFLFPFFLFLFLFYSSFSSSSPFWANFLSWRDYFSRNNFSSLLSFSLRLPFFWIKMNAGSSFFFFFLFIFPFPPPSPTPSSFLDGSGPSLALMWEHPVVTTAAYLAAIDWRSVYVCWVGVGWGGVGGFKVVRPINGVISFSLRSPLFDSRHWLDRAKHAGRTSLDVQFQFLLSEWPKMPNCRVLMLV